MAALCQHARGERKKCGWKKEEVCKVMQAREKKRRKSDKKEDEEARFSLLHNRMNMCLGRRERRMAISSLLFFFFETFMRTSHAHTLFLSS